MRVVVFDFGIGNLHSLGKALARRGAVVEVVREIFPAGPVDAFVFPGVGAFGAAAGALELHRDRIVEAVSGGTACLGICLGMQLLFDSSDEGEGRGLGLLRGRSRRLTASRVPQMGWNAVEVGPDPLFNGIPDLVAYYANSFVVEPEAAADVIGWSSHEGDRFPAAVRRDRTVGVQFHPEKSGVQGLQLLDNFLESL